MEDSSQFPSDEVLKERFGDLPDEELDPLRRSLEKIEYDPDEEAPVDRALRNAAESASEAAPPLPDSVRESFEKARLSAGNEASESDVYGTPKRYQSGEPSNVISMGHWHSSAVITAGLAVAAAVAVAFVTFVRPVTKPVPFVFADAITLLTPGEQTGFLEPIFTWKAGNSGVTDVAVRDADGAVIATLEQAFSPLRWSALEASEELEPGKSYELELSSESGVLATREFQTAAEAKGAPEPDDTLEGIISQCERLIADNRAADAWMLWGELNVSEKADPRMQELKEQILAVIAG